jgi:catechol 2,3-dioxygenase-like lactoylglutathione lyase family enzyme
MIGYVTIGVSDMEKAKAFWTELLEPLGAKMIMDLERIALIGSGMGQCMPTFYGGYFRDPDGNKAVFYHMG